MRKIIIGTSILALAAGLSAQINFVKNGDFSQVDSKNLPKLWKVTYKSFHNPKVADFTYKGIKRMTKAFQCNPGGASGYSKPYPLVILEQDVVLPSGIPLEVSADIIHSRASSATNADRGIVKFYLGNTLIDTRPPRRGYIFAPDAMCEQIAARVKLATGGKTKLKITFERYYWATDVVVHLDNVRIAPTYGPVFTFRGDRKIGKKFTTQTIGTPSAGYIVFMCPTLNSTPGGIPVPGIQGNWELGLSNIEIVFTGALDATGNDKKTGTCPNVPALVGVPLYFQPLQYTSTIQISLGYSHRFSFYAK